MSDHDELSGESESKEAKEQEQEWKMNREAFDGLLSRMDRMESRIVILETPPPVEPPVEPPAEPPAEPSAEPESAPVLEIEETEPPKMESKKGRNRRRQFRLKHKSK